MVFPKSWLSLLAFKTRCYADDTAKTQTVVAVHCILNSK